MLDGFSYLLGKKSGGGGSGAGWTTKNVNKTELVFKSLPEELDISLNTVNDEEDSYMIRHCHLVKFPPDENDLFGTYQYYYGQAAMSFTQYGRSGGYVAVGMVTVSIEKDTGVIDEIWFFGDFRNDDGFLDNTEVYFGPHHITIHMYKGTPIEIPTYTVTINNVSDPGTYNEDLVRYSIDGGNNWLWVNEPTIVLKDVAQIIFVDDCESGGYIRDENGNDIADASGYEVTYIPTKDTTLELYISW